MSYEPPRTADSSARALLFAAIVVSPQLLAGVRAWATLVICALSLVALLAVIWATWSADLRKSTSGLSLGLAMTVAMIWTALQAMPLPCSIVQSLAPKSVEQLRLTLDALGRGEPIWCALSRDPGNTELETIKGIAIVSIFCAAWLFALCGNRRFIATCVAWSTIGIAIVSLGHRLFLAQRVFGLYKPLVVIGSVYGPLINPNSLAGFLAMGFPLVLAKGVQSERGKRVLWYALAILVGAVVILTLSRGGIAAFIGASLLFGFIIAARRTRRTRSRRAIIFVGLSIASSAGLGIYVVLKQFLLEVSSKDFSKLELVASAFAWSLREAPWLGVGRGAFSVSFVQFFGTRYRFTHPENIVVQWISEWGVPVAVLLLSLIIVVIIQRLLETRSLTVLAALVGVVTIAAQNLLEFGLELTGVAVVASALLAVGVTHGAHHRKKEEKNLRWMSGFSARSLSIAVCAAGVAILIPLSARVLALDKRSIEDDFQRIANSRNRRGFRETFAQAMAAHPSEPNFALFAGAEAVYYKDPRALKLLNRTMQLAPYWPHPHQFAARWLFAHGRVLQALLEVREAENRDPGSAKTILCQIINQEPDAGFLLRAAPGGEARIRFLESAASCINSFGDLGKAIDSELLRIEPGLPNPGIREARRLYQAGHTDRAVSKLQSIIRNRPSYADTYLVLAEILMASNRSDEALPVLQKAEKYSEDKRALLSMRARAQTNLRDERAMRASLAQLRELTTTDLRALAAAAELLGHLENQLGNQGRALKAFEEANRLVSTTQTLLNVASMAEQLGQKRRAYDAYFKLCQLNPANESYCGALERLAPRKREQLEGVVDP